MARAVLDAGVLRSEITDGWALIEHRDHARLAGDFARHWGNDLVAPPQPLENILIAVARHDDAWTVRDASPVLTRDGRPSAFSKDLVGKYSAFEEIDFLDYLAVRGQATETLAKDNPYAAIITSMHTVNLLTEQADLSKLPVEERDAHKAFVAHQHTRQAELAEQHPRSAEVSPEILHDAFVFLQACDSLSLLACVDYPEERFLRHDHRLRDGSRTHFRCIPFGPSTYRIDPYPFSHDELFFHIPVRNLHGSTWGDNDSFRMAYQNTIPERKNIRILR